MARTMASIADSVPSPLLMCRSLCRTHAPIAWKRMLLSSLTSSASNHPGNDTDIWYPKQLAVQLLSDSALIARMFVYITLRICSAF